MISRQLKGSVKEPNIFHNYETEKITHKASDAPENLQLYRVVRFFRPRSSCTTHLMLFSECPPIVHDDLGQKNRTTRYNCRFSAAPLALRAIVVRRKCPLIYALCMTILDGRTEQHVIIGFAKLAAVDRNT